MAPKTTARKKGNYSTPTNYTIAGRLIKDPETETFEAAGKTVTRLKLTFLDATKSERHLDFFPEVYIDDPIRMGYLGRLRKDDPVHVEGKLEIRAFVKKDGSAGIAAEIRWPRVVDPLVYLGDRQAANEPAAEPVSEPEGDAFPPV